MQRANGLNPRTRLQRNELVTAFPVIPSSIDSDLQQSEHLMTAEPAAAVEIIGGIARRTIRELPNAERPRERMRAVGAQALSTTELIATILGSGGTGGSAITCASLILNLGDGSLGRLASMPLAALTRVRGVGSARATAVHAALELGRRMAGEAREAGAPLRSPRDVAAAFSPRLQDLPVEEFHVAILDAQHRLERDVLITRGLLNSSLVHPREVFREAIAERAAAVILVHNHPSGDPTPSAEDRAVTEQLVAAGRLLDIPVHDHIIVGRGRYVSFAEAGLL
jgi:DNA repair protein RadC